MTEPKFSIGDRVALLAMSPSLFAIPETVITDRVYCRKGETYYVRGAPHKHPYSFYAYMVAGCEQWAHERALRKIDSDEYSEPLIESREAVHD